MALNIKTGKPSPETLEKAVDKVLQDPRYRERAGELQTKMGNYDPIDVIIQKIEEVAMLNQL